MTTNIITNLRSYRILGLALFDVVTAILGTVTLFVVAKLIWFPSLSTSTFVLAGVITAIPLGVVAHALLGINTTLNYRLGLSNMP